MPYDESDFDMIQPEDYGDCEPLVALRMPRSPVLSFMLHFSTLGFYALFWVITVLRDLTRIRLVSFSAWFWLYAPFIYAQYIVAVPGLFKVLEERAGLRHYRALWFTWVIVSLGIVIFLFLFSRGVQPMWHYLLALTLWSLVHVFFEIRFSAVKRGLPWVRLESRILWIRIAEWVFIPAAFSGVLAVLLYLSLSPLLIKDLEALPYGGIYKRADMGFSIPIYDQGWRRVAPGSFSDAGAIFEMRGPVEGSHGVIHYYAGADMKQHVHQRMLSMQRPLDSPICRLEDHGAPGGQGGVTHLFCGGGWGMDSVFHAASLIETEHGVYELVLFVSVPSRIISRYRTMIEKMTKGFDIMKAD